MSAKPSNIRRSRRAFAAIMAITLIILVATTLAVMGHYFAAEATRTRAARNDAQLRQLLTAATVVAIQRADHPATNDAVALPPSLTSDNAALSIHLTGDADQRTAAVKIRLGERKTDQTLQLTRTHGRWHVR